MRAELPEVRTERLLLRRMRADDLGAVLEMYADPAANRFDPRALTVDQVRERFAVWVDDWSVLGLSYWLAESLDTGAAIGMGGIRHHEEDGEPVLNLAYRLLPAVWGQGYAAELAWPAVAWAERHMPDIPVSVVTNARHAQSLRVAEKLGFTRLRERVSDGVVEVLLRRPQP